MIVYRDNAANKRNGPPAWLVGADDLQRREHLDNPAICYWGIGLGCFVGEQPTWTPIGDKIDAAIVDGVQPELLMRSITWTQCDIANDVREGEWLIARALSTDGNRLIAATYDANFKPVFNEQQQKLLDIANAARTELLRSQDDTTAGVDMETAARWAAEVICLSNHISIAVLTKLGLLDEVLVLSALGVLTSIKLSKDPDR